MAKAEPKQIKIVSPAGSGSIVFNAPTTVTDKPHIRLNYGRISGITFSVKGMTIEEQVAVVRELMAASPVVGYPVVFSANGDPRDSDGAEHALASLFLHSYTGDAKQAMADAHKAGLKPGTSELAATILGLVK
jgi:hypothetical protein